MAPVRARQSFAPIARAPIAVAGALLVCLLAGALAGPLTAPARGEAAWTTYHRDAGRSGDDPDATEPIVPVEDWQSPDLGAPIWSQPLILGSRAYVATVGDEIYALDVATGDVVWEKSVGTPVPSGELPCGDVTPTVGIVGTPVIDTSSQVIYAVADTWNPATKEAHHVLKGLSLESGTEVLSTPVDPPGADPKAILQRTALNLDAGKVVFGFGGNDGDCSDYRGAVVAAPETGGAALYWQVPIALPSLWGGAVWAPSGPAVDGEGNIYATTGNPDPPPGEPAVTYDYSDSVVKLNSSLSLIGNFEPPNWLEESNNDLDLSSSGAELLPGGLLFQAGKDGVGYLIDEATMGSGAAGRLQRAGVRGPRQLRRRGLCQRRHLRRLHERRAGAQLQPGRKDLHAAVAGTIRRVRAADRLGRSGVVACDRGLPRRRHEALRNRTRDRQAAVYRDPSQPCDRPLRVSQRRRRTAVRGHRHVRDRLSDRQALTARVSGSPRRTGRGRMPVHERTRRPRERRHEHDGKPRDLGLAARAGVPAVPAPLLLHTRLRAGANGRVRLTLRCARGPSACRGTVTLRARFVVSAGNGRHRVRLRHARPHALRSRPRAASPSRSS